MRSNLWVASGTCFALVATALSSNPALAQRDDSMIAGTLGVGWADFLRDGSPHISNWLAEGAAVLTIDNPGLNVQVNFDNNATQTPSVGKTSTTAAVKSSSDDRWSYGGDVFWRDYAGSTGFNVTMASSANSGPGGTGGNSGSSITYGWFGQWFALSDLTLQFKGGRLEDQVEGWYGDAGLVFYPFADIALNLDGDYANAQHVRHEMKDATLLAEYLPVRAIPVSAYIGYDFVQDSQFAKHDTSVFLFGLKAYLGGGGREGSLVDYQRNGTTNWDGPPPTIAGLGL